MKKLIEQILKFGIVGVIATVIDFGVMIALVELAGANPAVAAGISFVVSLTFNYFASMKYVFTRREDISRAREFAIFLVLSLIGLALNEAIMVAGEAMFAGIGIDYSKGPYYVGVKIFATAIVMCWNFVSRKRWLEAPADAAPAADDASDAGR